MQGVESFPLAWPSDWQRTPSLKRKAARYKVSFREARDGVVHSLALMGVRNHDVVLSSNVPSKSDGLPYAGYAEPSDPGVAVYWTTKTHERRVVACDSWRLVRDNLRAVGLTLEALRTLERTGASEILNRAFTGFAALPPGPSVEAWEKVLGLTDEMQPGRFKRVTREMIEERYRELSKEAHPDKGGTHEAMVRLNAAREAALKFMGIG